MRILRKSIILGATVIAVGSTTLSAFAASPIKWNANTAKRLRTQTSVTRTGDTTSTTITTPYFIDEDGDGICDYYGISGGANWVDEDDNGVCDNYENGTCTGGRGQGRGMGRGQGRGCFANNTL